jgi:hypothetical protein
MTEEQIKEYLKDRGCRKAVWEGGKERLLSKWEEFVSELRTDTAPIVSYKNIGTT